MSSSLFIKFIVIHLPYNAYSQKGCHIHCTRLRTEGADYHWGLRLCHSNQWKHCPEAWGPPLSSPSWGALNYRRNAYFIIWLTERGRGFLSLQRRHEWFPHSPNEDSSLKSGKNSKVGHLSHPSPPHPQHRSGDVTMPSPSNSPAFPTASSRQPEGELFC